MRPPALAAIIVLLIGITTSDACVAQDAPRDVGVRTQIMKRLSACRISGVDEPALCGRHEVFEDRSEKQGRKISLNVVVLPATSADVFADPLVFLAGGGVVPATRMAARLANAMPALRRNRDIVLIDQRGSGGSNELGCDRRAMTMSPGVSPDERYLQFIAVCRDSLAALANLRFYTTSVAMDDLDDVREWLGYRTLNVFGVSYGSSAAQVYMRQYPTHVRSVVLHGVVPLDAPMPLDLARSAQQALDQIVRLCHDDVNCHTAFPRLDDDLATVLATRETPDARQIRTILNDLLTSVGTMRDLPMLIHGLATGDSTVLAPPPPSGSAAAPPSAPPLGVRLAILCSEGLRRVDTTTIARETKGTFLGDFPVRFQFRWCQGWPVAPLSQAFWAPIMSDTPTLLLNGSLDAVTPPRYAEHVKAGLANGRVVLLPNRSHNDTDPCVFGMVEAFVLSGGRGTLDTSCLARTPPIEFRIAR